MEKDTDKIFLSSLLPDVKEDVYAVFEKCCMLLFIEVGTEGLPDQWLHLHIVKKEMGRNICWSRKRWNPYCLSPGLGGIP